jgi:GNAT superfamily N-acetyltransferase
MDNGTKENSSSRANITVESAENLAYPDKDAFLEQVIGVENSAWPEELRASRKKFTSRLETFPQGFIVVRVNGVIKGVSTSERTTYNPQIFKTWDELTDNGFIKETHIPQGKDLYVVSVGVAQDTQGLGLGSKLVEAQKDLAEKIGIKTLFLGARTPGYDSYCKSHGDIPIEQYLELRNEKNEPVDPEIRFYSRRGLKVSKIVPNFEADADSRDFGAVMTWSPNAR